MYQALSVFDGNYQNGVTDMSSNCFFGTSFKPGYIGLLREVKYFMNRFSRKTFVGNLMFQGSFDGVNYTNIFVVGEEIHEGWNYYEYAAGSELSYRFYRFFGAVSGSCVIGEVGLFGYEVINDNNPHYTCNVSLILNGATNNLTGNVTYQAELTPLLTSISPRFSTVKGGELITLSGQNF